MTGIYKFVGIKHVEGTKDGRAFSFNNGCFVGDMSERDVNAGAKGQDVLVSSIPERYADVLCVANLGKLVELDTYFAKGRTNIGYARLADKK